MAGLETGAVCIKTQGKEAGRKVVVISFDKKTGITVIDGPNVKKRRCNARHLLPLGKKISVKKSMTKKQLAALLQ